MPRPKNKKLPKRAIPAVIVGVALIFFVVRRNWDNILNTLKEGGNGIGNVIDAFIDLPWWAHTLLAVALIAQAAYTIAPPWSGEACKAILGAAVGITIALVAAVGWAWGTIIVIITLLTTFAWGQNPRILRRRRNANGTGTGN